MYMNAGYATQIINAVPRTENEAMRKLVAEQLVGDNTDSIVAQAMLSALKFAFDLVKYKEGETGPGTAILTDLTTEVAYHYVDLIEKAVAKPA